jgi:hypothetical protein
MNCKRGDTFTLIPLGDIHIGNVACDEDLFRATVKRIAEDKSCYWVGLGDYADFVNVKDPRFSSDSLSEWIKMTDLSDLARAQRDRFLEIVKPIAGKCMALVEGNHERAIKRHYERDIYYEICSGIKEMGGVPADDPIALGITGWLRLVFYRSKKRQAGQTICINLHHGFVGGRLAGAKALNMQRWLWNHDADLVIFGHSHNAMSQVEAVEVLNTADNVARRNRKGVYGCTFLGPAPYALEKGYFPNPVGYTEIILRPGAKHAHDRIRVVT